MHRFALFVTASIVGGLGGFLGSVLGGALGKGSLFIGGFIGGIALAPLTGWIAVRRGWIQPAERWFVVIGAALGFVSAATLAINTLSSPVGPMVATTLTGVGALVGARVGGGAAAGIRG